MAITQKNRQIQIGTPLGDDVLLFYRMNGSERLGELFEYELDLLSENPTIDPSKLLGQNVTIALALQNNSYRYFNGYVTRFSQHGILQGLAYYTASVRPWLWFLTRSSNCRIFQAMTAPDIIQKVFRDQGFTDLKNILTESYVSREYCVQYRETDFHFVSRLMEEEGIYYYFTHENGVHHLVLSDSLSSHDKFPGYEKIPFHTEEGSTDRSRADHINAWEFGQEIQPGTYALTDYDFQKPKTDLQAKCNAETKFPHSGYEFFDYPGRYALVKDGESLAGKRLDERQSYFERCNGNANARGLCVGNLFTLQDHPRADQNREYLVIAATYSLQQDAYLAGGNSPVEVKTFDCLFTAVDKKQTFRPSRITPKPLVHGAQTAVVSGPMGEEIYTDEYGRVKVQFHWDRYCKRDENTSCWIRVAQPWAGKNWGMITLPRIGQEVVVDFLEGDPDQPLITGSVYNASQMPPYTLPDKATMSTLKSLSTKGGGGFNEFRFDDKKGSEQVFLHGEFDEDVRIKHDAREWIGNERHLIVVKDQLEEVDGDKHATVKGDHNEEVKGTASLKTGQDLQQKIGAKHALDAGSEIHLKAGQNIVIEAGMSITLKVGGNFILLDQTGGLTMVGTPSVMINSGGSAGSGSDANPHPPTLPTAASDDSPGSMDNSPLPAPPHPKTYGPSSTVLKLAAESGTPFCQKCAEAAAARAAQSSSPN